MATSHREDEAVDNNSTNRQKRGISFTGMLRDSLSLLVPSFVLDATTPKRRRVQEDMPLSGSSTESVQNEDKQLGHDYVTISKIPQTRSSTPTGMDHPSSISLYPSLGVYQGNNEIMYSSASSSNRQQNLPVQSVTGRSVDQQLSSQGLPRYESIFANSAKRTRLNDSHVPSSSQSGWTHTSGSSSSGSLLGETYHQSPFYPGKTSFGGASNYRRETLRGRLNAGKRSQTTVVPLRLNSVISQRDTASTDDLSDMVSSSTESEPILSAATRRILRAMRRHTESSKEPNVNENFGTTARSIRHQRHALWTSCVRRRGKSTHLANAPPTMELRRFPQSTSREANNMFSSTSWPRDTIGVPPASSSTINSKHDYRMFANDYESSSADVGNQIQRTVGVLSSSYVFSSPAIRSQPSTRPPSNASAIDVGRPNFTFQSPPSRSASSNALTDLVSASTSNVKTGTVPNLVLFDQDSLNKAGSATGIQNSCVSKLAENSSAALFQSKKSSLSQSASSPMLFSGSRTLPEIHPPFDALPVSIPSTSQVSSVSSAKRALPQDSWRCEACLAENAFLVTSCRVCQRAPSSTVVASQREWHTRSDSNVTSQKVAIDNSSKQILPNLFSSPNSDQLPTNEEETAHSKQVKTTETSLIPINPLSSKWRCQTCLVENLDKESKCVCCQSSKPQIQKSSCVPLATAIKQSASKWRCETCLVENPESENKCLCCQSSKPKTSNEMSKSLTDPSKSNKKWRCDICMVENDPAVDKCVCCEGPKTGSNPVQKSKSNQATIDTGLWRCDTCLVENKSSSSACICCEAPKKLKSGEDSDTKKSQTVIQSGGLLSTWKTSSQTNFNFGNFSNANTNESAKSSSEQQSSGIKDPTTGETSSNLIGNLADGKNITNSVRSSGVKFGFGNSVVASSVPGKNTTNSVRSSGVKFGFGNSDVTSIVPTSSSENAIKFGSSHFEKPTSCVSFKFGEANSLSTDKNVNIVNQSGGSSFRFSNHGVSESISFGGNKDHSEFNFGNSSTLGFTNSSSQDGSVSGSAVSDINVVKSTAFANDVLKSSSSVKEKSDTTFNTATAATATSDGLKQGSIFKLGQSSMNEVNTATVDRDNAKPTLDTDPITSVGDKINFGNTKIMNNSLKPIGNSNFAFGQIPPSVSLENQNSLSFLSQVSSFKGNASGTGSVGTFTQRQPTIEPFKTSKEFKVNEDSAVNGPSNQQVSSLCGLSRTNKQTSASANNVIPAPSTTSIESIFSKTTPKMSLNKQDTVITTLGASANMSTGKNVETSLFGGVDSLKQKRLTGSISSPALSTLPGGHAGLSGLSDPSKKITPVSFNFGKSSSDNSAISDVGSKLTNASSFEANKPQQQSNPFIFGCGNSAKQSIFGTQSQNVGPGSSLSSNVPIASFGNTDNQNNASRGFDNGPPMSNASSIFSGNADSTMGSPLWKASSTPPVFGSSVTPEQPFVFGSSNTDGPSIINSNAQAQATAPSVPNSFQFGQQSTAQSSLFVFGNNSNPTSNTVGTANALFGSTTANPFSSQAAVTGTNSARPIKKAHRRLRKQ